MVQDAAREGRAAFAIGPEPTALLKSVSANALRTEIRNTLLNQFV